ncbi:MAG: hypothetical protein L0229_09405 [Blastocatellia bacterium]|nr:hypothetical protein [Blastocatellia bacterium]
MKDDRDRAESSRVARDILTYMYENPDTQGTIEGIIEWWLLEQQIERGTALVKEAITDLVARGLVIEQAGMDARVRYQIDRSKIEEIRALLGREIEGEDES